MIHEIFRETFRECVLSVPLLYIYIYIYFVLARFWLVCGDCIGKEEEKEGDCVRILIGSLSIVHSCKVFHSSLSLATVSPSALF